MKHFFQLASVALISGSLLTGATALAQQSGSTQQTQNQYSGVSNPPDTPIVANEPDITSPAATQPKPSAALPAQPSLAAQPQQPAQQPYSTPPATAYYGEQASPQPAQMHTTASGNSADNYDNTDFGIVTQLPDQRAVQQVQAQDAQLGSRNSDPSFNVVSVIPFIPNALNPGTNITVRLLQPLSSNTTPQGTPFRATIVSPVYRGSQLVIPAGSELRGVVTDVHPGRHLISRATLRLTPQFVLLPDGNAYRVDAEAVYTSAPHANTTQEGAFQPRMHLAKDSAEYGAGAGLGAIAGAQFGPAGALIGTLVGAGAVSAHMLIQPPSSLTLPRNAEVVFSLTQPMELTPTRE
ncbi:MAG: hypothetical protein ACP5M4_07995 [Acidobacteriaceae bacterium]